MELIICLWALSIIIYSNLNFEEVEIDGWGRNAVRDPLLYLNTTSLLLPKNFCRQDALLLVIIPTKPSHMKARHSIRTSWAMYYTLVQNNVSLYFLVGTTRNYYLQTRIEREDLKFDDIIQEDFNDAYLNLTIKSLMMLKLATTCGRYKFLLKADDDTLVNLNNIAEFLSSLNDTRQLLTGQVLRKAPPVRRPGNKWYIPHYLYSDTKYPDYINGCAYLMSMEVAKKLYEAALHTPILPFEDVYITGICAVKAGIPRVHSNLFLEPQFEAGKRKCLKKFCVLFGIPASQITRLHVLYKWC